jgi:hypothetical protein
MEPLLKLVIVAPVAWAFWAAFQPRCAFVVRVEGGQPRTAKGVVTPAFLAQVREACLAHGARSGTVRGLVRGRRIALAFAGGIPPAARQQLRNWWVISGWPARPRGEDGPPRRA